MLHFLLGITLAWAFWELCERYAKRGLLQINPITFLLMVIWGSSGFFLLRIFPQHRFSSVVQFFSLAVPDWDIPLSVWTGWDFLTHRSLLFNSTLLPIACIGLSCLLISLSRKSSSTNLKSKFFFLHSAIGLSVGISAHLIGDVLLNLFLYSEDIVNSIFSQNDLHTRFGFEISNQGILFSLFWVALNSLIGFAIPFAIIKLFYSRLGVKS